MFKALLIVSILLGAGNTQTNTVDVTPFDSMEECKAARLLVQQSQFPIEWLKIQNDNVWYAESPALVFHDKYKLECLPNTQKSSTQEY